MKRFTTIFLMIICIAGLLVACNPKNKASITFTIDANGMYEGFLNLPTNYIVEEAEKDGYYVMQDSEAIANNEVWDNFIETSAQGNNAGIRIVSFFTEDANSPYFTDLFFNDDYYYIFDNSSDSKEKQPYMYLLTLEGQFGFSLEGQFGVPSKESGIIVLTNDKTLTFDTVMKSLTSSMAFIQSGSPYRIVMFQ